MPTERIEIRSVQQSIIFFFMSGCAVAITLLIAYLTQEFKWGHWFGLGLAAVFAINASRIRRVKFVVEQDGSFLWFAPDGTSETWFPTDMRKVEVVQMAVDATSEMRIHVHLLNGRCITIKGLSHAASAQVLSILDR